MRLAAGWRDVAIPKPYRPEAERQGEFYSGQNAKALQVSVSGQPTRHGKRLKERDALGPTAHPRRGSADPTGARRGGRHESGVPTQHSLILFHRQTLSWL